MEPIGAVVVVGGQAFAEGEDGIRELSQGSPVYLGDVLTTSESGNVEVLFNDETVLSQGANARIDLDTYVYQGDDADGSSLLFKMAQGTFRLVTGKIAEQNPQGVELQSPLATIGIRGTGVDMDISPRGERYGIFDYHQFDLTVTTPQGTRVITDAGVMQEVNADGTFGMQRPYTPGEMEQFNAVAPITRVQGLSPAGAGDEGSDAEAGDDEGGKDGGGEGEEGDGEGEGEGEGEGKEGEGEEGEGEEGEAQGEGDGTGEGETDELEGEEASQAEGEGEQAEGEGAEDQAAGEEAVAGGEETGGEAGEEAGEEAEAEGREQAGAEEADETETDELAQGGTSGDAGGGEAESQGEGLAAQGESQGEDLGGEQAEGQAGGQAEQGEAIADATAGEAALAGAGEAEADGAQEGSAEGEWSGDASNEGSEGPQWEGGGDGEAAAAADEGGDESQWTDAGSGDPLDLGGDEWTGGDSGDTLWGGAADDSGDTWGDDVADLGGTDDGGTTGTDTGDFVGQDTVFSGGEDEGDDTLPATDTLPAVLNPVNLTITDSAGGTLMGTTLNDTLTGGDGDDYIEGGAGNDIINGGQGTDSLYGGDGDDLFIINTGDVTAGEVIDPGEGDDTLSIVTNTADFTGAQLMAGFTNLIIGAGQTATFASDQLTGETWDVQAGGADANLSIQGSDTGAGGGDVIDLSGLNFSAWGTGNRTFIEGGAGADTIIGGGGNNVFVVNPGDVAPGESISGGSGTDRVQATGSVDFSGVQLGGIDEVEVQDGCEVRLSLAQLTQLRDQNGGQCVKIVMCGADGASHKLTIVNDTGGSMCLDDVVQFASADGTTPDEGPELGLDFGGNAANITGGVRCDLLVGTDQGDTLDGGAGGNDTLVGGLGDDSLVGGTGGEYDIFKGGAGDDTMIATGVEWALVDYTESAGPVNVNLATGIATGEGTDSLSGITNVLGTGGDDTLTGSAAGGEYFRGGAGSDVIDGGGGSGDMVDYYDFLGTGTGVNVNLGTGQATGHGTDTLTAIDHVFGSDADDTLTGHAGSNVLRGNKGSDLLDGQGGEDRADYGKADGAVTVNLFTGRATGADGDDTLVSIEGVSGSAYADTLTGDSQANGLFGRGGDDVIVGGGGEDSIEGGAGDDRITVNGDSARVEGGDGDDTIINTGDYAMAGYGHSPSAVYVDLGFYSDGASRNGLAIGTSDGSAPPVPDASGHFDDSASVVGVDSLVGITDVFGSQFNDTIIGTDLDEDWIEGGDGSDILDGGGGLMDMVSYSMASSSVVVDLAAGTATGGGFTDTLSGFERAFGSSNDDTLYGDGGDNLLRGRTGDDSLDGRAGFDEADYRHAQGAVQVDLAAGSATGADGTDTLVSIEGVRGSYDYGDVLTGDGGANLLRGYGGDDTLSGGDGADTLEGGEGVDSMDGGAGDDIFYASADGSGDSMLGNTGTDIVSYAGVGGAAGQQGITLDLDEAGYATVNPGVTGVGADRVREVEHVIGTGYDDVLIGTTTLDTLEGGGGHDYLEGSYGNDYLDGGAGDDTVDAGTGDDTVIGGLGDDSLSGGTENDSIDGGVGDDTVTGGDGNDTILGGSGADSLSGDAGDDSISVADAGFVFVDGGTGADTLRIDASGINVDATRLTGLEMVHLDAGGNSISLSEALVDSVTTGGGTLKVRGGGTDAVSLSGNWTPGSQVSGDGTTYGQFTSGGYTVLVEMGVSVDSNALPTSTGGTASATEDTAYVFTLADFGYNDADGDPLEQVQITTLPAQGGFTVGGVSVAQGQMVLRADIVAGNLAYTPAADANGFGYASFDFKVHDGHGWSASAATMTIDVAAVNDAPTATNFAVTMDEDSTKILDPGYFNFSDVDGDSMTSVKIVSLPPKGTLKLSGSAVTAGQEVSVSLLAGNQLTYDPLPDEYGMVYSSFTYQVSDGTTWSGTYSAGFNVIAQPDPPSSSDTGVSTVEDTPHVFTAAEFPFSDPDAGDQLQAVEITSLPAAGALTLDGVAVNVNDTVAVADIAAGKLVFTPGADESGAGYASFGFKVSDGQNWSASAQSMVVNVSAQNDPPAQPANSTLSISEDTSPTFSAGSFDFSDADAGDTLAAIRVTSMGGGGTWSFDGGALNAGDEIAVGDLGLLEFTPGANEYGSGYATLVYEVSDGTAWSAAPGTITIDVSPENDAPTGGSSTLSTPEGTAKALAVSDFNFYDVDGDSLDHVKITALPAAGSLTIGGQAAQVGDTVTSAQLASGELVFTPTGDENGTGYAWFGFQLSDGTTYSAVTYSMTFNVVAVSDPPTSADASVTGAEDQPRVIAVGDFPFSDPDAGDSLQAVRIEALPAAGALTLNGVAVNVGDEIAVTDIQSNLLVFTPDADGNGAGYATFDFKVGDGGSFSSATYTMTVDVTAVNDAPTSSDTTLNLTEDVPYTFQVSDFPYSDIESDPMATVTVWAPSAGTLALDGVTVSGETSVTVADITAGKLVYTPAANASGTETMPFKVGDGTDLSTATFTVNLDIQATNDAPDSGYSGCDVDEGDTYVFAAEDFPFSDLDAGDTLQEVRITVLPTSGTLKFQGSTISSPQTFTATDIDNGDLVYIADSGDGGSTVSMDFAVSDGYDWSSDYSFEFNVLDVPAPEVTLDMDDSSGASPGNVVDYAGVTPVVFLADPDAMLYDPGDHDITSLTVTLDSPQAGDVLDCMDLTDLGLSKTFDGTVLTITGLATYSDYEAVLRSVAFSTTTGAADTTTRTLSVVAVNDIGGQSDPVTVSVVTDMTVHGTIGADASVASTSGDDAIMALGGDDTVEAGAGDDTVSGGAGADSLDGGEGDDWLSYAQTGTGVSVDMGKGTAFDGAATDTFVNFENVIGTRYSDTLEGRTWSQTTFMGGGGGDSITGGGADTVSYALALMAVSVDLDMHEAVVDDNAGEYDTLSGITEVIGSRFNDYLAGDVEDNVFRGGYGDDTLVGGDGFDSADFSDMPAFDSGVEVNLGTGMATAMYLGSDSLDGIECVVGTMNADSMVGAGAVSQLIGLAGDDTLAGSGGGVVNLVGGFGVDDLDVSDAEGFVTYAIAAEGGDVINGFRTDFGTGADFVTVGNTYFPLGYVGQLRDGDFTQIDGFSGTGTHTFTSGKGFVFDSVSGELWYASSSDLSGAVLIATFVGLVGGAVTASNILVYNGSVTNDITALHVGTDGADTLTGTTQEDNLLGLKGADLITGDEGADTLRGGEGDDTLSGGDGDDFIEGGSGADNIDGGAGDDNLYYGSELYSLSIDMTAGQATVNGEVDTFTNVEGVLGTAFDDLLVGDANAEWNWFHGGAGNDTIKGMAEGWNEASYRWSSESMVIDLDKGSAVGQTSGDTDVLVNISDVEGSENDDTISGRLYDYNWIDGRGGSDLLSGGLTKWDTVSYGSASAPVVVDLDESLVATADGTDTISGFENAYGSAYDDSLYGSDDDNRLRGRGGDDYLDGRGGLDVADYGYSEEGVYVDLRIGLATGDGIDTLVNIEGVRGSDYDDDFTGAESNDSIEGRGGHDDLSGSKGADTLYGGDGDDTLYADEASAYQFSVTKVLDNDMPSVSDLIAADLDGDGDLDVLAVSSGTGGMLWYENQGGGVISSSGNTISSSGARSLFVADLDGDGDLDMLTTSYDGDAVTWYEHTDGAGTFGAGQSVTTLADGAMDAVAADMDGDGDLDVVSASEFDNRIAWYENTDGAGAFGTQRTITTSASGAAKVVAADLDGDGDMDVLSASSADDKIAWYENTDGAGTFGAEQVLGTGADYALDVIAADLDNDGDLDVVAAAKNDNTIAWYENTDGEGTFGAEQEITTFAMGVSSVVAVDIDRDGDLDLLAASTSTNTVGWYENDGHGSFGTEQTLSTTNMDVGAVCAADLDGDFDLDVLSGSSSTGGVAWYENLLDGAVGQVNYLSAGYGYNKINGGSGRDELSYEFYAPASGDEGLNISASGSVSGANNVDDIFTDVEQLTGSHYDDFFEGSEASDSLKGLGGDDTFLTQGDGDDRFDGGDGTDFVRYEYASSGLYIDIATGVALVDGSFNALGSVERVEGGDGNDVLVGSDWTQTLMGGAGDDTFMGVTSSNSLCVSYVNAWTGVNVDMGLNGLEFNGYSWTVSGVATGEGADVLLGVNDVVGSTYADTIIGHDLGGVWIEGGEGGDVLEGGAGRNDAASYSSAENGVVANLATGLAQELTAGGATLYEDTLTNFEWLYGSHADDTLVGDGMDNWLRGREGDDSLDGGGGLDVADYRWSTDGVNVNLFAGTATGDMDTDTLTSIEGARGGSGRDTFVASADDNWIDGRDDRDLVSYQNATGGLVAEGDGYGAINVSGYGDDTLYNIEWVRGSEYADEMSNIQRVEGGGGDDTISNVSRIYFTHAADGVDVDLGASGQVGGSYVGYAQDLAGGGDAGIGTDVLSSVWSVCGSDYADSIVLADGGGGACGGLGDDTLVGGASSEDWVEYYWASGSVVVDLSAGTATGADGDDQLSGFEAVGGSYYDDTLIGSTGDETFSGGLGDDVIDGGAGSDYVGFWDAEDGVLVDLYHGVADGEGYDHLTSIEQVGGTANRDTFIAASDSTFFDGRDGRDYMNYGYADTGVSAANAWDGTDQRYEASVTGWGTATLHNVEVFIGGAGNDSITGFLRMSGGLGDDTFGATIGWESVDYGHSDTGVNVDMDFYGDVGGGVYHGKATGEGADSLEGVLSVYGSDHDDTISGTGGNDTIMGRLGNDVIDGTGGQDQAYYWFSESGVYVDLEEGLAVGQGFSHTLANIEHVSGSDYDDTLVGDGGDNAISGQWGSDLLVGGEGIDTLSLTEGAYVDLGACRAVDAYGVDTVFGFEVVYGYSGDADTIIGANGVNEALYGQSGDDSLSGMGGNDTLDGGSGEDTLVGGDGDDSLSGGDGHDKLYGGDGADWISGGEGMNTLSGGLGDDTLVGSSSATDWADYSFYAPSSGTTGVVADAGSGTASGEGVAHSMSDINGLIGSDYDDTLTASMADGGAGSDSLVASSVEYRTSAQGVNVQMGAMTATSGSDVDTLVGTTSVTGSRFADTMTAADGTGVCFYGEGGNDTLTGANQADHLEGGLGDDVINGLGGNDVLEDWRGSDTLDGGEGDDTMNAAGDNMADDFDGNTGTDKLDYSGAGGEAGRAGITLALDDSNFATVDDSSVGVGADRVKSVEHVVGTAADDTIVGATGAVTLDGYMGDDSLVGGVNGDSLVGGEGDDTLSGGDGTDCLFGGVGDDSLVGGAGADTFYYSSLSDVTDGCDQADFTSGTDVILLDATSFGALASGGYIDASRFEVVSGFDGSNGSIGDACVVYDDVSQTLYYDSNGSSVADGESDFMEVTTVDDVVASDIQIA